jgi:hypothetical protein
MFLSVTDMTKNQIPSVVQGVLEKESGSTVEIGSHSWWQFVENAQSFRYVPTGDAAPYTVRKEKGTKGQASYWYGYRKTGGVLSKRYIGRTEDLSVTKLEAIAHELSTPTSAKPKKPKVTEKIPVTQDEEVGRLQKDIEELQRELEVARGKLKASLAHLEASRLENEKLQIPDYVVTRDRYLASLKLGKQAPEYKKAEKHVNGFIKLIEKTKL